MDGLGYAILFYIVFSLFGIIGFALTIRFTNIKNNLGYILAKPLGVIMFAYPIWLLSSLKIIKFSNNVLILLLFALMLIASCYSIHRFLSHKKNSEAKKYIFSPAFIRKLIATEAVMLAVFIGYLFFRSMRPEVGLSEKFMDYFLYFSSGRTDYFPFFDGWWASKPINYYYYGYYVFALITKVSGVPFAYGYNLCVGLLFALSAQISFGLVKSITKSKFFGFLGAAFVVLAGNLHFANCYFKNFGDSNMHTTCSFQAATRVYDDAQVIAEFPAFNMIQGDFHPHVISIPFFLLNLSLIHLVYRSKKFNPYLMAALIISMGTSLMINTWDFMTLGLLFAAVIFIKISKKFKSVDAKPFLKKIVKSSKIPMIWAIMVAAVSILLFLPFFKEFKSPVTGIGFIPSFVKFHNGNWDTYQWPSTPWFLIGIWGIFLVINLVGLILLKLLKTSWKNLIFPIALSILSVSLIIFTELFFFEDMFQTINPPFFRGNTVFKFSYHAWILFSISSAITLGLLWNRFGLLKEKRMRFISKYFLALLIIIISCISFIYPIEGSRQFFYSKSSPYANARGPRTLDSNKFIAYEENAQFDLDTINWLNTNEPDRVIILEAPGGSYYFNSRLAAFTGNGNVINWRTHEKTWHFRFPEGIKSWRDTDGSKVDIISPEIEAVENEVVRIYESNDIEETKALLKKYTVSYVYVGGIEHNYENLNESKFAQIGTLVYQTRQTKLYKLKF